MPLFLPKKGIIQGDLNTTPAELSTVLTVPQDDTDPLASETLSILTISFTPTIASSETWLRWNVSMGNSAAAHVLAGIWLGAATAPTTVTPGRVDNVAALLTLSGAYRYNHSDTSAQSWALRVGGDAGTTYINRCGSGSRYNGALECMLEIWEVLP